jgi:hypothetical protein
MQPLHNESKHGASFSGVYAIIYNRSMLVARTRIVMKFPCPGKRSYGKKYGDSFWESSVIG